MFEICKLLSDEFVFAEISLDQFPTAQPFLFAILKKYIVFGDRDFTKYVLAPLPPTLSALYMYVPEEIPYSIKYLSTLELSSAKYKFIESLP